MNAASALHSNDARKRFFLKDSEAVIGFVEYYGFERIAIVTHTEICRAAEGKGQGSELARQALAYFRNEGRKVVPVCGFFAHFLRKHPEHADSVTPESRRIFKI